MMILGPTPDVGREDPELPTPAQLEYVVSNLQRPSVNTLPPDPESDEEINEIQIR